MGDGCGARCSPGNLPLERIVAAAAVLEEVT